jgi:hypothetical protein
MPAGLTLWLMPQTKVVGEIFSALENQIQALIISKGLNNTASPTNINTLVDLKLPEHESHSESL